MSKIGLKRVLSLVLVIAMIITALPMALADSTHKTSIEIYEYTLAGEKSLNSVNPSWNTNSVFGNNVRSISFPANSYVQIVDKNGDVVPADEKISLYRISEYSIIPLVSASSTIRTVEVEGYNTSGEPIDHTVTLEITIRERQPIKKEINYTAEKALSEIFIKNDFNRTPYMLGYVKFTLPSGYYLTQSGYRVEGNTHEISVDLLPNYKLVAEPYAVSNSFTAEGYTNKDEFLNICEVKINISETGIISVDNIKLSYSENTPQKLDIGLLNKVLQEEYSGASIKSIDGMIYPSNKNVVFYYGANKYAITNNTKVSGANLNTIYLSADAAASGAYISYFATTEIGGKDSKYTGTITIEKDTKTYRYAENISVNVDAGSSFVEIPFYSILDACHPDKTMNNMPIRFESYDAQIGSIYIKTESSGTVTYTPAKGIDGAKIGDLTNDIRIEFVNNKISSDALVEYTLQIDSVYYIGKINLKAEAEANQNNVLGDVNVTLNTQTKRGAFSISDISQKCSGAAIGKISFTFDSNDVELSLAGERVVSNSVYDVVNAVSVDVIAKKYTSDIRIYYTAASSDGKNVYRGSVVVKKVESKTIGDLSAHSIYTPGGSVSGKISAAEINALVKSEHISSFRITNASFNYVTSIDANGNKITSNTTIYSGSWKNSSTYGLLTLSAGSTTGASSFITADTLYYVPGVTGGTATITYEAYGQNTIYIGTLTYTVYSAKDGVDVKLNLKSRDAYALSTADSEKVIFVDRIKNAIKDAFDGKATVSYLIFNEPSAVSKNYGTLYSNSSLSALSYTNRYYFNTAAENSDNTLVSSLYYVPTTIAGTYTIGYDVYVTFENEVYKLHGILDIVTPADKKIDASVFYQTVANKRVNFKASDFSDYVKTFNKSYVFDHLTIKSIPEVGTLSYSNNIITSDTIGNYMFYASTANNHASIANVSYFPTGTNYYVEIPFTVYYQLSSVNSTVNSREGTIVICVTNNDVADIKYTVLSSQTVSFNVSDFTKVCTAATGSELSHVYFDSAVVSGGKLYYNTTINTVNTSSPYYVSDLKTPNLSKVKFYPSVSNATVSITYSAYSSGGAFLYKGTITITLYDITKTPTHKSCTLTKQKIVCNGESVSLQAYNIDNYNYIKLRDVAALMAGTGSKFSIRTSDNKEVYCTLGENYTKVADDLKTGKSQASTCVASSWTLYVNNVYKPVYVYNIGGYSYFKLRDLGDALNFVVDYDVNTNTAIIKSADFIG